MCQRRLCLLWPGGATYGTASSPNRSGSLRRAGFRRPVGTGGGVSFCTHAPRVQSLAHVGSVVIILSTAIVAGEVHHGGVVRAADLNVVGGFAEVRREDEPIGHGTRVAKTRCARIRAVGHGFTFRLDEVRLGRVGRQEDAVSHAMISFAQSAQGSKSKRRLQLTRNRWPS